VGSILVVP
jgi:hypothetical protein